MKIAVVGTSNSIAAKGYFPVYQAIEYPNIVDNFSLGASYCHYIPFALEKYVILENYHLVITDCCPNDGSFFPYARTENWLYNELFSIFSHIKENNCKQLHLIFPTDLPAAVHEHIHKQVCAELDIPFLDIGTLLKLNHKQPNENFYADKMHIAPFYAAQMAYLIKQKTTEILNNSSSCKAEQSCRNKKYFVCQLTKHTEFPQVTRASSLRAENFIQLKNHQEICLDNLPQCNLESLYFYTNIEAGYYHLSTEQNLKNYNLACHLANIFHFRPLPASDFAVNKFLKIQAGFNPQCQQLIEEFNFPPHDKNTSELLINALLFSQEINPPRTWQPKEAPAPDEIDLKNYKKINAFLSALHQYRNRDLPLPEEFIFTGAMLFPAHPILRKNFTAIIRKTKNPYYYFYFAKLYLMPRKKYAMAAKLLEQALSIQNNVLFAELLAECCLEQNLFDKAFVFIQHTISNKFPVTRLKLLVAWAAKTNRKKEFILYAQKMLEYGISVNHMILLAKTCLCFQEKQLAKEFLTLITNDPRNFHHEEDKQKISMLIKEINSCC